MSSSPISVPHALAETAAAYGLEAQAASHTKLSISLPADLVAQIKVAASESGMTVSGVIAAALRGSIAAADQARLNRALELDAEDNIAFATEALALTARAWKDLEW